MFDPSHRFPGPPWVPGPVCKPPEASRKGLEEDPDQAMQQALGVRKQCEACVTLAYSVVSLCPYMVLYRSPHSSPAHPEQSSASVGPRAMHPALLQQKPREAFPVWGQPPPHQAQVPRAPD